MTESPILFRSCGHETRFLTKKGHQKIGDSVLAESATFLFATLSCNMWCDVFTYAHSHFLSRGPEIAQFWSLRCSRRQLALFLERISISDIYSEISTWIRRWQFWRTGWNGYSTLLFVQKGGRVADGCFIIVWGAWSLLQKITSLVRRQPLLWTQTARFQESKMSLVVNRANSNSSNGRLISDTCSPVSLGDSSFVRFP